MALDDCVNRLLDADQITEERAQELLDEYGDAVDFFQKSGMSEGKAQEVAAAETFEAFQDQVVEKSRQKILQAKKTAERLRDMEEFGDGTEPGAFYQSLIEYDPWERGSNINVRRRYKANLGRYMERFHEVLAEEGDITAAEQFKGSIGGIRGPKTRATGRDIVRELYAQHEDMPGESTGNEAAKMLARAYRETKELAADDYIVSGGALIKRDDHLLPNPYHSVTELLNSGKNAPDKSEWVDFVLPRLDPEKMIDYNTGEPLADSRLRELVGNMYDNVVTEGRMTKEPGVPRRRILGNNRSDHRFLVFRDADAWLEYNDRFGTSNPWDMLIKHIDSYARDTAQMEVFGPNVKAGREFIKDVARRKAQIIRKQGTEPNGLTGMLDDETDIVEEVNSQLKKGDNMMKTFRGDYNNNTYSRTMSGLRNIQVSAQMGSAVLPATSDLGWSAIRNHFNGMPAKKNLVRIINRLNPAKETDRQVALRSGMIANYSNTITNSQRRFFGFVDGPGVTQSLSKASLQLSLLEPWTNRGRWMSSMEVMGHFRDMAGFSYDELADQGSFLAKGGFQRMLDRYGITPEEWDIIRSADPLDEDGAKFLRPADVENHPRSGDPGFEPERLKNIALKMHGAVATEVDYMIPSTSLRARTFFVGGSEPGSFLGEVGRSMAMYKNFPMTLYYTHLTTMLYNTRSFAEAAGYAAAMGAVSTLFGAAAIELGQIAKGRDPLTANPETNMGKSFWIRAFIRGGAGSLWADYILQDQNRYGENLITNAAGPVGGFVNDSYNLTIGNFRDMIEGNDSNFGRDATDFLSRYMPGGNIFYLRAAKERLIFDQLQRMVDPEAYQSFRREEQFFRQQYNQDVFWEPGEAKPDRVPDIGAIIEDDDLR